MSEVVAVTEAPESQFSDTTSQEVASEPATPAFDEATYKKKIQGYTSAINAAKEAEKAARAEAEALKKWKAEREQAEMSEFEKAQARIASLEAEAASAKAEAAAVRLGAKYPLAAELLGDDLARFDEVRVAEINGRLAKEQAAESEPEPRIDANSPRRTPPARPPANDRESAVAALIAAGNPFYSDEWR